MPIANFSFSRPALLVACVAAVLLTGCGDSTIKAVQNTTLPDDDKITIARVLKDRKACDKTEWGTDENSRGQKIVTYKCYFSTKELNREQKTQRERFIASAKNTREAEQKRLKALDPEIKAVEKKLQPLPKDKEPDLAALEKTPIFTRWRKAIAQMEVNAGRPYDPARDEARLLELVVLLDSKEARNDNFSAWLIYGGQPLLHQDINATSSYYRRYKERIESGRKAPKTERRNDDAAYYQEFSSDLQYIHDNLPKIKPIVVAELDKRINAEKSKTQKENEAARRQVDNANRPIQREIDRLTAEKERLTQKLASYGKDFEKQLQQRAEQQYPDYDAVFEAFGWEVDRQGRPSLEIGGLMYQSKQDDDDFRRYVNPAGILNRIAKFDAKDFANYRQELGRVFVR